MKNPIDIQKDLINRVQKSWVQHVAKSDPKFNFSLAMEIQLASFSSNAVVELIAAVTRALQTGKRLIRTEFSTEKFSAPTTHNPPKMEISAFARPPQFD